MKDFAGKVAVVTGGASGIGRAIAERFAEEGMRIGLADVEPAALAKATAEMKAEGANVLPVRTDVSKDADMAALVKSTVDHFGAPHLLVNNAGVGISGKSWEISLADWEWVLGVDLWGVVHGIRHFVPVMLESGARGHIVNVASMAGLMSLGGMAPYHVSKHGVVTLSECLYQELLASGGTIGVSVLCPAWVQTRIADSDRNRPSGLVDESTLDDIGKMIRTMSRAALGAGMPPKEVAQRVFDAVLEDKFYILTHELMKESVRARMTDFLEERQPTIPAPSQIPQTALSAKAA
ncbi:MAG: SDR family NAD(P)-dependent oxidoreductase, partial [Candidatus Hydrogenedentota bacterium]